MNIAQQKTAEEIIEYLYKVPLMKMFVGQKAQNFVMNATTPCSFDAIRARIHAGKYPSVEKWESEMKQAFKQIKSQVKPDTLQATAIDHLYTLFMQQLAVNNPKDFQIAKQVKVLNLMILDYLDRIDVSPLPLQCSVSEPGAEALKTQGGITTKRFERDLRLLRNPEYQLRVGAFIYKRQPEAVSIGNTLKIKFDLLSDDVRLQLRTYLDGLLKKAAMGEIDPFGIYKRV